MFGDLVMVMDARRLTEICAFNILQVLRRRRRRFWHLHNCVQWLQVSCTILLLPWTWTWPNGQCKLNHAGATLILLSHWPTENRMAPDMRQKRNERKTKGKPENRHVNPNVFFYPINITIYSRAYESSTRFLFLQEAIVKRWRLAFSHAHSIHEAEVYAWNGSEHHRIVCV